MKNKMGCHKILVPYKELFKIGVKALHLVGVPQIDAKTTANILLIADVRGISSHGIQRLLMYVPRLREGLINPAPAIRVKSLAPAVRIVHGDDGLGPVVAARGMQEAIDLAKDTGVAFVGCKDSNHFGAAAPYVLMACKDKMIGIAGSNAFPTMAPWGGLAKLVGNNPLAVGVPYEGNPPFVLDMAMSVSSRGRMRRMAEEKEQMPEGWAINNEGKPTKDPLEGLKGFVLPIASYKGYALAVAMDILSGVMTGAGYSTGIKSLIQQSDEPQHIGHFLIAIDPARFMPWTTFSNRMKQLCDSLRKCKGIDTENPVLIPGDPEARMEKVRMANGIPFEPEIFEKLRGLGQGRYDYNLPQF